MIVNYRRAKAALKRFETATYNHAFKGTYEPKQQQEVQEDYDGAKLEMENLLRQLTGD